MNRKFVAALSCLALAGTGVGLAQAAPKTDRIGGIDRYDTAVQIAARTFTGHQNTVYIARGDLPVDALVAGQLTDGPVLLSPLGQVNPRTLQALQGYSPKEIIFLGKAFPASTINAYQIPGAQSWVMGGKDRQETSALIAGRAFNGKSLYHLYVAAPDGIDAVASGALTDAPIVLAYPDGRVPSVAGLPADTARVCIGAACNYVSAKERVQGKDRFETAELLAKRAFPNGFTRAYVGRSDNFIDAVVGGTLTDAPILLVHPSGHGNDRINALNLAHVTFLGGPGALPDNVLTLKPQPKPTNGLGLPWAGKINPLFAGTGAFQGWNFNEYTEVYDWANVAAFYGTTPNNVTNMQSFMTSKGILTYATWHIEGEPTYYLTFNHQWKSSDSDKPSNKPCPGELCDMSIKQKASYIQAHRDKLEVLIAQKLSERLQTEEGMTLNLTRDFTLINPYREWASGMPRDLHGDLNLARVDKDTGNDNNELGESIQHFRYLPEGILVQVMPSYRGSLVRDGILAMVGTTSQSSLDDLAQRVADEYWSSSGHWAWVKRSGTAGTSFSCGVSSITDHGPWFQPDSDGVMAGDGRLTVACGSSINSLNRIP